MANAVPPANHSPGLMIRYGRLLRRRWRQWRGRWRASRVRFVYHDGYAQVVAGTPMDPLRGQKIIGLLEDEGLLDGDDVSVPRRPALRSLLRVHRPEYLESLGLDPTVTERIFGERLNDDVIERVVELQRLATGGTIQATRLALQSRSTAVNLGGGFHHAARDRGLGFCIYNDIAVAVTRLRAKGFKEPILVVDLDIHDGNGTREIFAHDSTVYTYSVHNQHWGPTEAVASTAIALGPDVEDELYLGTLLKTLPDVMTEFRPGLVIYIAGSDPAADDELGNWRISADGMLRRDRLVVELLRRPRRRVPLVVLLGGGYGSSSWRYSARFLAWLVSGKIVRMPDDAELVMRRFQRIRGELDPSSLTAEPSAFSWRLTEDDLVGIMPEAPRRTRFLAHFSPQGVELLLERLGILDRLRLLGFRHPSVEVDLTGSVGDTVRIFSEPDCGELLMELRVNRSTRVCPGCQLLVIEWLLLQNPRAHFGPFRRQLPGQSHPGLGLLKEIFGWLIAVSEILELDGIYYVPSSYHVAIQSRRRVRFLEPEHEALAQALEALFADTPLPEASSLIAGRKVVDRASGAVLEWRGYPMVLPVSPALKERVSGADYDTRVAEARSRLELAIAEPG
ncbi:MAG: histone deacetylase [Thermoanaerobaculales bacterium]|nr:histone deacetylase [Thermoanaerobaculales bacterium]